jgi:hypothetical protein
MPDHLFHGWIPQVKTKDPAHNAPKQLRISQSSWLVQRHKETQPGFNGRGGFVQFVPVKRVANFRAQRVARSQTARLDAERLAHRQYRVPHLLDGFVSAHDFKAILAGVAGARYENVRLAKGETANLVLLQKTASLLRNVRLFDR